METEYNTPKEINDFVSSKIERDTKEIYEMIILQENELKKIYKNLERKID